MARERIDTEDGMLAVCNFVQSGSKTPKRIQTWFGRVDGYDVYLPQNYWPTHAIFLLHTPNPFVTLHYTREDL